MINKGLFSSKSDEWETPQDLFDALNTEFHFTLDPCATKENAKCKRFFTREDNGLLQDWSGRTVFINPPYGREISKWVQRAHEAAIDGESALVVMLIPARTDTQWWHRYVMRASEIRFVKGRIKFVGAEHSAPFPSAVIVFDRRFMGNPIVKSFENHNG